MKQADQQRVLMIDSHGSIWGEGLEVSEGRWDEQSQHQTLTFDTRERWRAARSKAPNPNPTSTKPWRRNLSSGMGGREKKGFAASTCKTRQVSHRKPCLGTRLETCGERDKSDLSGSSFSLKPAKPISLQFFGEIAFACLAVSVAGRSTKSAHD